MGGAFAARLWWLLRHLSHDKVAVLNGGIQFWQKRGYPLTARLPNINSTTYRVYTGTSSTITSREIENGIARRMICLLDARTTERFNGANETIDRVAGHIPRAINHPFQNNLDAQGLFCKPDIIKANFLKSTVGFPVNHVVHMCGSGVTACHNVLAMEWAGLCGSKLYSGSWSEWIINQNRAIVKL
jgi:thiosulfate/3-mercaptopyruvate sulfurtransferase